MHGMQKVRWIRNGIGVALVGAGWSTGGLVIPGGVDSELADEFAGGDVEYADVQVPDEHQDRGAGVLAAGSGCFARTGHFRAGPAERGGAPTAGADLPVERVSGELADALTGGSGGHRILQ
jgi:hypothetical protein